MAERDQLVALAVELAKAASQGRGRRGHRRAHLRRQRRRTALKWPKVVALMVAVAVVIPVAMITLGWLFGPRGYEGLIAAPLSVLTAWAVILFFAIRSRTTRRTLQTADLAQLPAQTGEWLEHQRAKLPEAAQSTLESIAVRLEGLTAQVQGLDASLPEAVEVRRLIGEELPALVQGYQRLPEPLRRRPLHDGPSPEHRLIEGLATVDEQIGRVQQKLADGDLHSLATHQRYLELKYKNDDKLE